MSIKTWKTLFYASVVGLVLFIASLPVLACTTKTLILDDGTIVTVVDCGDD